MSIQKMAKKLRNQIQFGFACAGYNPTSQKVIFSEFGKAYLHIIFLFQTKSYICNGLTFFNKSEIPRPYNNKEFTEFYSENPPSLKNDRKLDIET